MAKFYKFLLCEFQCRKIAVLMIKNKQLSAFCVEKINVSGFEMFIALQRVYVLRYLYDLQLTDPIK